MLQKVLKQKLYTLGKKTAMQKQSKLEKFKYCFDEIKQVNPTFEFSDLNEGFDNS